jgi:proline iminopeptidase
MNRLLLGALVLLLPACAAGPPTACVPAGYLDASGHADALAGGVRMIPITTPSGTFRVWTKRVGENPRIKVLLLHGGPGVTHEYLEAFDSYLPAAGIEYYYYDQLGSAYSDQPDVPALWSLPRFVDEVEQVRRALGLDAGDFYLYGQSWGGLLAIEYALKYQQHLKGLVISNMVASAALYNVYANDVLRPQMDPQAVAEIERLEAAGKTDDPRYMALLIPEFYEKHILRMPYAEWPDPVVRAFAHLNQKIYVPMQGPSEFRLSGALAGWDRMADLPKITVPTLVIGARWDTMDPAVMEQMAKRLPHGRYLYCPNGSHLAIYDDQQTYMAGLTRFIEDVDAGRFP